VELQPDNSKYRNNLAAALVDAGRADDAVRHLSMSGSPAVAHYNVGFMLLQKEQRAEAGRHLQQALALDPGLTPAREMLAQLGGESPAQPQLARPQFSQAAPRTAAQPRYAAEETYAPPARTQGDTPSAPQTYHIGDDGAAAETAQRPHWNGAAWSSAVAGETSLQTQPLPPVD